MTENAVDLLKHDHRVVEKLFARYEDLGDRAIKGRETLVAEIAHELSVHVAIEEEVFYPRIRAIGTEVKDEVLEAIEEHRIIKTAIAKLATLTADDERYDAKVKVLMEQVTHHVKEEEDDMFPRVRKHVDERTLIELGNELQRAKQARGAAGNGGVLAGMTAVAVELKETLIRR